MNSVKSYISRDMLCCKICSFILFTLLNLVLRNDSLKVNSMSLRLPNNSYPLKYDLRIKVHLEKKLFLYEVREKIHIKIKEPTESITMNSKFIKDIKTIAVLDISSNITHKTSYKFMSHERLLIVDLPYKIFPNSEILLKILFHSYMNPGSKDVSNNNRGIILSSYTEPDGSVENMIFTGFDPNFARECFPCFDEPAFKAPFELEIEHDEHYNAVSNMPVVSRKRIKGNQSFVRTKFQETPKMSTYLLAFFVLKLQHFNVTESRVPQKVYTRNSNLNNEFFNFMITNLGKILQSFEDLFKIPYSLPKLDHVVVPNYYRAIENWGVIGYSEQIFNNKFHGYLNTRALFHEIAVSFEFRV